jgi:hypothetical protein
LPHNTLCPHTGEALKANITTLGPLVLPFSEQLLFALNMVARKLLGRKKVRLSNSAAAAGLLTHQHVSSFAAHACMHACMLLT